ncbi:hypothetical protein DBV15_11167 [Temnothorax longispinosus]|uniref:Uncharacterized protein n=1 Tax=Temnothorax longispinosus TaxID=300112 RepID=A0A4S2L143_9HYME|nr:hypothetical protein DBV15_11167 [Temnothorax longispinosus]
MPQIMQHRVRDGRIAIGIERNCGARPQTTKTSGDRHKILPFPNAVRLVSSNLPSVVSRCRFFYPLPGVDADITNPEGNSQSVSPSEESSCSFPIRISPPLFPFFTRDKESIEAWIQ